MQHFPRGCLYLGQPYLSNLSVVFILGRFQYQFLNLVSGVNTLSDTG